MNQDERYSLALSTLGPALRRMVRGFEAHPERRQDLLQDIHVELWRSLKSFNAQCALRTWVFRVAHNVYASHVLRSRRLYGALVSLDELAEVPSHDNPADSASNQQALERVRGLIQRLKPPDALVMSLYLEDIGASEIGEIIGLSATAVATRIHRIKTVLAGEFHKGGSDDGHT